MNYLNLEKLSSISAGDGLAGRVKLLGCGMDAYGTAKRSLDGELEIEVTLGSGVWAEVVDSQDDGRAGPVVCVVADRGVARGVQRSMKDRVCQVLTERDHEWDRVCRAVFVTVEWLENAVSYGGHGLTRFGKAVLVTGYFTGVDMSDRLKFILANCLTIRRRVSVKARPGLAVRDAGIRGAVGESAAMQGADVAEGRRRQERDVGALQMVFGDAFSVAQAATAAARARCAFDMADWFSAGRGEADFCRLYAQDKQFRSAYLGALYDSVAAGGGVHVGAAMNVLVRVLVSQDVVELVTGKLGVPGLFESGMPLESQGEVHALSRKSVHALRHAMPDISVDLKLHSNPLLVTSYGSGSIAVSVPGSGPCVVQKVLRREDYMAIMRVRGCLMCDSTTHRWSQCDHASARILLVGGTSESVSALSQVAIRVVHHADGRYLACRRVLPRDTLANLDDVSRRGKLSSVLDCDSYSVGTCGRRGRSKEDLMVDAGIREILG